MKHSSKSLAWRYYFKRLRKGKVVLRLYTGKMNRISYLLKDTKFSEKGTQVYIRLEYGKKKDNFGKLVGFYNDGLYSTRKEAELAWQAFIGE